MIIERSRERIRKTGEVFTPEWLVKEMLGKLQERDPTLFTDASKTFLEPSCGDGNFLAVVLEWKIQHNAERNAGKQTPWMKILRSLYGIDLMPDNVEACKRRLTEIMRRHMGRCYDGQAAREIAAILDHNIVCHDALTWDYENWQPASGRKAPPMQQALDDFFGPLPEQPFIRPKKKADKIDRTSANKQRQPALDEFFSFAEGTRSPFAMMKAEPAITAA